MSFEATISVDGKEFPLRQFYLSAYRENDTKGRPSSKPAWFVICRMDAVDDTTITSWMIDPHKQIEGTISLSKIAEDGVLKEIKFKKAMCFGLYDSFNGVKGYAECQFTISGEELHIKESILVIS